ncbi:MAG: cardiolipin synthase [Clostridiales bacterium]|nr:cardiolipin synthase [Clostridiales bacterium]
MLLLLFLQLVALVTFAGWVMTSSAVIYYAGIFLSVLVFSFVLKKDEASVYKITWLILILVFPSVGGVFYLLFGNKRPLRDITAHMKEHALIAKILDADVLKYENEGRIAGLMKYIRGASSFHAYGGTQSKYFATGEEMFVEMIREIRAAERFIFLESYIVKSGEMWDGLLDALAERAEAGVEVRLIADHFGSHKLFTHRYLKKLRAKKIYALRFNQMIPFMLFFMNNRDHRKILVVDGKSAFTGGINVADEYINLIKPFGIWKDTGIKLRGDAVWSFTLMFMEMWNMICSPNERIGDYERYKFSEGMLSDGLVIPYGDTPLDNEQLGENVYVDILNQAEDYVYIFTPYFIASEKLIGAFQLAAKRGVDVRIVTPGIPDKKLVYRLTRSYYRYMHQAGVKIYEYSPGFLHGKSIVCDDKIAVVGTINFDYRSLYLNFECAALLYNCSVIKSIRDDALRTINESREVAPVAEKFRMFNDLFDAFLHLFAPVM